MTTTMGDPSHVSLFRLAAWLSPAYPVSAYAYSHGIEQAVAAALIRDAESARAWIADLLEHGAGRTDAILLAAAWRAADDGAALAGLAEFAEALAPARERREETLAQGRAFADTTRRAWGDGACEHTPYPVVVGGAAGRGGIALDPLLALWLQAWTGTLVSACVRLVPLGQTEGQEIVAAMAPITAHVAEEARAGDLHAIGGAAILSDIAAMRHETLTTRIFRT